IQHTINSTEEVPPIGQRLSG
ncbi:unnamed protein product, partial [Allacma fusca]